MASTVVTTSSFVPTRHEEVLHGVSGQNWTMDLVLNDILASTGTLHEFHDEPGVRREDKRERFSPCHYHGSAPG